MLQRLPLDLRHLGAGPITGLCFALAALVCAPAQAADWRWDNGTTLQLTGTVTAGTAVRTESADPSLVGAVAGARVGLQDAQLVGNAGSNDLNFQKGRPVSTVVKGLFDLTLTTGDLGLFLRARAWSDQALEHGPRDYGNYPNGFARNAPLSDQGFDRRAKFSNAVIDDANLFGRSTLAGRTLDWRVGRQVLDWGVAQFIGGGINSINPLDTAAAARPGALPDELRVPVGGLHGRLALRPQTTVEGWLQYEFRPTLLSGCGTFYAVGNFAPSGCNFVNVLGAGGVSDATALATDRYVKRAPDQMPSGGGQFGLSIAHRFADLGTEVRGYLMNLHSRTPFVQAINANIDGGFGTVSGAMSRLTDPNGLKYALTYAQNIRLLGASFSTALDPARRVYGEAAYRPNQPIQINAADLIAAFVGRDPASALNLSKGTNSLAPGAVFDGFDRYPVTTITLGASQALQRLAGASRVMLAGEVGWSHVGGLPDAGQLRYGRSDDYGVAAVTGGAPCSTATAAGRKQCPQDGFVTPNAWGYRLQVAAIYPQAFAGATLTPSFTWGHDVSGYSYNGGFLEGRKTLRSALRAQWGQRYFADLAYTRLQGGRYFTLVDRDTVTLSGGARF